jgi:membrane-associated phospholipid phosphatase
MTTTTIRLLLGSRELVIVITMVSICIVVVDLKNGYLVASFILLASFVVLAVLVSPRINLGDSAITRADAAAYIHVNDAHYGPLNQPMILFSQYGREVAWTAAAILLFIFGGWTGRKTAIVMAITLLILIPIGTVAKEIVGRQRPVIPASDFLVAEDSDYGFPSGHAVITSAGAAVSLALFRNSYKKMAVSIGLATEAALVCFSRVYIGGHYPLDVVSGILLGVGVAFIFVAFTKRIDRLLQPVAKALKR